MPITLTSRTVKIRSGSGITYTTLNRARRFVKSSHAYAIAFDTIEFIRHYAVKDRSKNPLQTVIHAPQLPYTQMLTFDPTYLRSALPHYSDGSEVTDTD